MRFHLHRPGSAAEAVALCAGTNGTYLAGGTVLLAEGGRVHPVGGDLISIEDLPELHGIREENGSLFIGAAETFDALEWSEAVKSRAHALWQAAREVGGPQIRNRATIGGNVADASPAADGATPLLALDAVVETLGPDGPRSIPIRSFFHGKYRTELRAGELVTGFRIRTGGEVRSAFRKVGKRTALAVSCLNIAAARRGNRIDVAVGAAAPRSVWCEGTSEILSSGPLTPERLCAARERLLTEISPIDDRWGTAEYKREVCARLLSALMEEGTMR